LAVAVAGLVGGEIVGTDSMQAYRGMDIGTATPTREEQRGIPHHMIDVWEIDQSVTVVDFRNAAREAIDAIKATDKTPVVVGGSGLYVRAVLEELEFPATDPQVRAHWEEQLTLLGAPALHALLAERDPFAAAAIEINNGRRIVRALEVNEITGEPFIAQLPEPVDHYPTIRVGLRIDRDVLDARIEQRVDAMWDAGFVDEVHRLQQTGLAYSPTARLALGYEPILRFLTGEISEAQARQITIDDTRKFARRQQRWFTKDERIQWWDYNADGLAASVVELFTST
jgi:tRNA dimethylallyltransferase